MWAWADPTPCGGTVYAGRVRAMTTPAPDIELLYRWRAGDRAAGDQLVREYYPQISRFFSLRCPEVADDLTQRVFLALTEARERVEGETFRGYLYGVARKLQYKYIEVNARRDRLSRLGMPMPQSVVTPSGVVALRQEHWLLLRALQRLSLDHQTVLALAHVEGLQSREIAEALEVPVSTVTTRVSRAREALRKQVASLRAPAKVHATLAEDLDAWMRALGPIAHGLAAGLRR